MRICITFVHLPGLLKINASQEKEGLGLSRQGINP